jgi:plasmid stabilization system protein ParE
MENYTLTREAEQDLTDIVAYIASDSVNAAENVLSEFEATFPKLGDMPGLGHFREELLPQSYRFHSVYSYLVVYRWERTPIEIIAIIHGGRDLGIAFQRRGIK